MTTEQSGVSVAMCNVTAVGDHGVLIKILSVNTLFKWPNTHSFITYVVWFSSCLHYHITMETTRFRSALNGNQ